MAMLVSGAARFIGFHVTDRLLARGDAVVGLDNLNADYDVSRKWVGFKPATPAREGVGRAVERYREFYRIS